MNLPTKETAHALLSEAERLNPGPWVAHSRHVAQAAAVIAERHPRLDPEVSYILGLLHDIGRRAGVSNLRHAVDGYRYLMKLGYPVPARVCLTHCFPLPDPAAICGAQDCSPADQALIRRCLTEQAYDDYDLLIQLCDGLALPAGFCLLERRFVDAALRYGVNDHTVARWRATLSLKRACEETIGTSVYDLLPGVVENTFFNDHLHDPR